MMHSLLGCPPQHETVVGFRPSYLELAGSVVLCSAFLERPDAPGTCAGALSRLTPLENCIASTSILKIPSYKEPTVDALAPDADEGRGWLR